jgi:hypothetical protein
LQESLFYIYQSEG